MSNDRHAAVMLYAICSGGAISYIWEQVHQLDKKSLFTLARGREFTVVGVKSDRIEFVPKSGKGTLRWAGRDQIEHIASLKLDKSQLTPTQLSEDYPNDQNLSYIAAIVRAIIKNGGSNEQ